MLRPSLTLLVALLAFGGRVSAAQSAPAPEPLVAVAHALPSAALLRQARLLGRQAPDTPVSLALTLPLRNQPTLNDLLHRLYDPSDPAYGHYLTGTQFNQQFAPTATDYQVVLDFAQSHGLTVHSYSGGTVVGVTGTSAAVENAFRVHLNDYRLASGRIAYANDVAPEVPASIAARLGGIVGLDSLVQPQSHLRRADAAQILANIGGLGFGHADFGHASLGSGPVGGLSPSDIKAVYNLKNVGLAGEGQRLGLIELGGYNLSDIAHYNAQFGLGVNPGILQNIYVSGTDGAATSSQVEVVLDIDLLLALVPRAQSIFVYEMPNITDASSTTSFSANFLEAVTQIADDDFAQSISCSVGAPETSQEAALSSTAYQALFDAENAAFQKMAVQGQSFFDAAGDAGAFDDGVTLSVDNPGGQPYVTAVGGTTLSVTGAGTTHIAYSSETTWNSGSIAGGAGGGGSSNFFRKPYYQYINALTTDPSGPLGASATMRDMPDVSLDADPATGYDIYVASEDPNGFLTVGGTSAAAPLWAAFAALVNEARATGSTTAPTTIPSTPTQPVGFINPLIYRIGTGKYGSYANDFHDIADGSTNLFYPATTGFDDATGWGSFNGANLLADMAAAGNAAFTGPSGHAYPAGLALVSVPSNLTGLSLDFAGLFGLTTPLATNEQLILWQPSLNNYVYFPTAPADTIRPGVGYWLRVPTSAGTGLLLQHQGTAVASPFTLTLQAGWNQIGDPFPDALPLTDISVALTSGGTGTALPQAGTLVSPVLYTYAAGATAYTQETNQLTPYAGYWVYARAPITLTMTDPAQ